MPLTLALEVDTVTALISTLGFPIVMCLLLGFFIYKSYNDIEAKNNEREAKLYELIAMSQNQSRELMETNSKFVEQLALIQTSLSDAKDKVEDIIERLQENQKELENRK